MHHFVEMTIVKSRCDLGDTKLNQNIRANEKKSMSFSLGMYILQKLVREIFDRGLFLNNCTVHLSGKILRLNISSFYRETTYTFSICADV